MKKVIDMKKKEIIESIKELITSEWEGFYSFLHSGVNFHKDYCKYELTAIYVEDDGTLKIECIGYNSFAIFYFNADELSTRTLKMIEDNIEY